MDVRASLKGIKTFVATVRAKSFTQAASTLHVSQGAVSQQIARLEDYLGVELFERSPRGLNLTTHGRRLFLAVGESIDRIDQAVDAARIRERQQQLALTTLNSFAAQWLMPRMIEFERRHPNIRLRCETGAATWDLASMNVDAGIRFGNGQWPGLNAEFMFEEKLVPVAAPAFLETLSLEDGPNVLKDVALIYDLDVPTRWGEWFVAAGIDAAPNLAHGYIDNLVMISALRCNPDRVGLVGSCIIDRELLEGRLVRLFDTAATPQGAYYLVYPTDVTVSEPFVAFRAWLFEVVATYVAERDT